MELQVPKKLVVIPSLIIILMLTLFLGVKIYQSVVFRIVSTNPRINSVAAVSPFFKIIFNKPLSKNTVVAATPRGTMLSYQINGSTITVLLNTPLNIGKPYSIILSNITDSSGAKINNTELNFTPQDIPTSELPTDQQQAIQRIQLRYNNAIINNKLVKLLPFTSGGNEFEVSYNVSYVNQQPKLLIIVTAPTEQDRLAALNWMELVGVSPSDYTIQYNDAVVGSRS